MLSSAWRYSRCDKEAAAIPPAQSPLLEEAEDGDKEETSSLSPLMMPLLLVDDAMADENDATVGVERLVVSSEYRGLLWRLSSPTSDSEVRLIAVPETESAARKAFNLIVVSTEAVVEVVALSSDIDDSSQNCATGQCDCPHLSV